MKKESDWNSKLSRRVHCPHLETHQSRLARYKKIRRDSDGKINMARWAVGIVIIGIVAHFFKANPLHLKMRSRWGTADRKKWMPPINWLSSKRISGSPARSSVKGLLKRSWTVEPLVKSSSAGFTVVIRARTTQLLILVKMASNQIPMAFRRLSFVPGRSPTNEWTSEKSCLKVWKSPRSHPVKIPISKRKKLQQQTTRSTVAVEAQTSKIPRHLGMQGRDKRHRKPKGERENENVFCNG